MKAYLYDEITKEFISEVNAQIDPLETKLKGEDVYLLPANATFEKPLDKAEGKAVVFDGSAWQLVDDNRGKFTVEDGSMREITTLDPVEKILTDEEVEGLNNGTLVIIDNEVVEKPAPTYEDVKETRAFLYRTEVDPLMAEYTRKKTFNLFADGEEEALLATIESKVAEIKENNPYPAEVENVETE